MNTVITARLKLISLTHEHLLLTQKERAKLEKYLGLNPSAMIIDPLFKTEMDAALLNFWLPNTYAYPDLYHWYTNWQIVVKSTNTIIGSIGFGGYPDDYGETTIGYMVDQQHQSQGYATEALQALSRWGFSFSMLKAIAADTKTDNPASKQVLLKAGFRQTHTVKNALYFKLKK